MNCHMSTPVRYSSKTPFENPPVSPLLAKRLLVLSQVANSPFIGGWAKTQSQTDLSSCETVA